MMKNIKICRFHLKDSKEAPVLGIVEKDVVYPISTLLTPNFTCHGVKAKDLDSWSVEQLIPHWSHLRGMFKPSTQGIPLTSCILFSPLSNMGREVFCVGKNYKDHVQEMQTSSTMKGLTQGTPSHPIIFTKTRTAIIGTLPSEPQITISNDLTKELDYEAELGVVIGEKSRAVSEQDAWKTIFGFTLLNDVTARDLQRQHAQWVLGKSPDTFCPVGPWIVPVTELPGGVKSCETWKISCWINGELRQQGYTKDMIHSIPKLISTISKSISLQPGDLIATGTPSGVGAGFNPPKFLKHGDLIRISLDEIGTLENRVVNVDFKSLPKL